MMRWVAAMMGISRTVDACTSAKDVNSKVTRPMSGGGNRGGDESGKFI